MIYLLFVLVVGVSFIFLTIRKAASKKKFEKIHRERENANAPKILYLRGFNVDGDDGGHGNMQSMKLLSKEHGIAADLISFGHHLVAIGKPDEDVPYIGFDRKKFSHDTWQSEVLKMMLESDLIIYRPDTSPGVLWEIGKVLELGLREKLIVWTDMGFGQNTGIQEARYNIFRRRLFELFLEKIPDFNKDKKFLVSNGKDRWEAFLWIIQTPIYNTIRSSAP